MTFKEKQFLAAIARDLIVRLEYCEDSEFANFIIRCVASADKLSLDLESLQTK